MYGIIYCATNNLNKKKYVGQTQHTFELRKTEHINEAKKGKGFYFHKALKKYDFNFTWEILEYCKDKKDLNKKEKFYIKTFNTFNSANGYNLTLGGEGNKKIKYSSEEIKFILQKRRELNGRKIILEQFNKNFEKKIKNIHSLVKIIDVYLPIEEEQKIKFEIKSFNSKQRIETEQSKHNRSSAQVGKKHSEERKQAMRVIKLGTKHKPDSILKMTLNNKRTIQFTKEQEEFIIQSFNNKISRRQILISLNTKFDYNINLTSTSVVDRVIKQNTKIFGI